MKDYWIEEKKHHFSWEPKPYWRYHKLITHYNEPLGEILKYNVKKAHIDKFDENGGCINRTITKKDKECGKYLKGRDTESIEVDTKNKKITVFEKDQWDGSVSIDKIVFHNLPEQKCRKALELQKKRRKQDLWEINELGNWFGWGKKTKFTKNIGLPKKIKDELKRCKKILVDNFGGSRIQFPHDHKCHRIRLEAEHLIYVDNLKALKKIAKMVGGDVSEFNRDIKDNLKEIKKLRKKQWKTGVPVYET